MQNMRETGRRTNKRLLKSLVLGSGIFLALTAYSSQGKLLIRGIVGLQQKQNEQDNDDFERQLSIDYGNGTCKWQPPAYYVPDYIDFHKTIVAGFPR